MLGIYMIADIAVETDQDELSFAISFLGREVLVVYLLIDVVVVEPQGVARLLKGDVVVPGERDRGDGGLGVSHELLQKFGEPATLEKLLELAPFDATLGDEVQHSLTLFQACPCHDNSL